MRRWAPSVGRKAQPLTETKDIFRLDGNAPDGAVVQYGYGRGGSEAWSFTRAVAQGYTRNTWLWKGIDGIAFQQAKLFWGRRKWGDGHGQQAPIDHEDDHPLVALLNRTNPNPLESPFVFRARMSQQLALSPRGVFVHMAATRRGASRLTLLPPHRTRPIPYPDDYPDVTLRGLLRRFEVRSANPIDPPQQIPVEEVRWIKNPHPSDPWRSMTVVEALGLTADLDYFARVYASSFVKNDGRPGMTIGVDGDLEDHELQRIEDKFGSGPTAAGRSVVISGKVSAVDMARSPREADYRGTRKDAKDELLTGLGTPESVMGNASGRTFANADAELENFWTITMDGHLVLLAGAFHEDMDGQESAFDLSNVEALQRAKKEREDRARSDFEQGLISVDEYRQVVGRDPFDQPETRSLIIATTGKAFIPKDDQDREALDALGPAAPAAGDATQQQGPPGAEDQSGQGGDASGGAAPAGGPAGGGDATGGGGAPIPLRAPAA